MAVIDDAAEVIRIKRPWGEIVITNNEVGIRSDVDDPPGLRLESRSRSLGKFSGSHIRADGSSDEHVLVQFKRDERTRARDDLNYGEMTVHIKGPQRSPDDDGMRLVGLFLHDYIWLLGVNGEAPAPPALVLPPPTEPPVDPPTDPDVIAHRRDYLASIAEEFAPMEIDPGQAESHMQGRSTEREVHATMIERAGVDPCGGTRFQGPEVDVNGVATNRD